MLTDLPVLAVRITKQTKNAPLQVTRVLIGDTTVDRSIEEQVTLAEKGGSDEAILEGGISPPRTPMGGSGSYGQNGASFFGGGNATYNPGEMQDVPITPEQQGAGSGMRQRAGQRKQQSEFTNAILLD